jgi:hypothetical protein
MEKSLDAIIITAAPGIGKTTIFPILAEKLPRKSALLDGDNVGCLIPFSLSQEWLNLVQDNIAACAENFARCGIRYFVTCFCLPSQERLNRLTGLLSNLGYQVHSIALIADDDSLLERNRQRGGCDVRDADEFAETLHCNKAIKELEGVTFINTTNMSPEHIGQKIVQTILYLTKE